MNDISSDIPIARVIDSSEASDTFALAEWVLGLPRVRPEAVAVCGGQGETIRVEHAAARYKAIGAKYFLFTGITPTERTYEAFTAERLAQEPFNLSGPGIVSSPEAAHTKAQAVWLVPKVRELGIRVVELHAPAYHIVRAYLTVLAHMLKTGESFILVPYVTPYPPEFVIPETGAKAVDMTPGEYGRILKYQKTGDVATLAQLREYLAWFWQQPEVKNAV